MNLDFDEVHMFIENLANQLHILYGGSCNAKNTSELYAQPDVDDGVPRFGVLRVEFFSP